MQDHKTQSSISQMVPASIQHPQTLGANYLQPRPAITRDATQIILALALALSLPQRFHECRVVRHPSLGVQ